MAGEGTLKTGSGGIGTNNPVDTAGTTKPGEVDLEALAAEIYRLLKQELRLERERGGRG
jgi:hypothetical protein